MISIINDPCTATVSVKIVGTTFVFSLTQCLCTRFWFNCNKQHWEGEETGEKEKTVSSGSVPTISVWDCSHGIDITGRKQSLLLQSTSGFMNLPMASHSFACKASTTGTLILTEADAASSESACSRRTEAAIEPAPSAKKQCLSSMLSLL